jgi:hypothetical protein
MKNSQKSLQQTGTVGCQGRRELALGGVEEKQNQKYVSKILFLKSLL